MRVIVLERDDIAGHTDGIERVAQVVAEDRQEHLPRFVDAGGVIAHAAN